MDLVELKTNCEVCGSNDLHNALDLGSHPLCDDLVPFGDARECIPYPIEILYCTKCATAHQRFQIPKKELFPTNYHYRPRFTADVLSGMSDLVNACEKKLGSSLSGKTVLDIGCNDASLLGFFRTKGAQTIGVEPTFAFKDGLDGNHVLYNDFFDATLAHKIYSAHGSPDVITFTNVFAHIENLSELIHALKILMSPKTMLVVENHYLGSVLQLSQFDTFYHEHIRTYSLTSFLYIAKNLEMSVKAVEFPSRYGGNIRVFLSGNPVVDGADRALIKTTTQHEKQFAERLRSMQIQIHRWKTFMGTHIADLVSDHGPLVGKAFPGRAAILIQLLDLDVDTIQAVYEKPNSMKIGHYVPGTRIPIESEKELFSAKKKPRVVLNLAWHISEEIHRYLNQHGYEGKVIDILNPADF